MGSPQDFLVGPCFSLFWFSVLFCVLLFFVSCALHCRCLLIVHFQLPLRFSLTFIYTIFGFLCCYIHYTSFLSVLWMNPVVSKPLHHALNLFHHISSVIAAASNFKIKQQQSTETVLISASINRLSKEINIFLH